MKFENPNWRFESPGPLTDGAVYECLDMIRGTAAQGKVQDILEDFKYRFSGGSTHRSSTASWAESDLYSDMKRAAENAPVFIEAFVNGCADVKEQGCEVPSLDRINRTLAYHRTGYTIDGDTLVQTMAPVSRASALDSVQEGEDDTVDDLVEQPSDTAEDSDSMPPQPVLVPLVAPGGVSYAMKAKPKVKVFLCHSSGDKAFVKTLYQSLKRDGYDPWLDAINLLPGQDWESEIKKAVRDSHIVVVCLSNSSTTKTGFVQKEIKFALDVADEQPEGQLYIIPARLEPCQVPLRLSRWHWVDLFEDGGYEKLVASLEARALQIQ